MRLEKPWYKHLPVRLRYPDDISFLLIAGTVTLLVYQAWFSTITLVPSRGFPDRSIGITVLSGIDANGRTLSYILSILASVVMLSGLLLFFSYVKGLMQRSVHPGEVRTERSAIFYLSVLTLFLLVFAIYKGNVFTISIVYVLLMFVALLYYTIFLKGYLAVHRKGLQDYYHDHSVLTLAMVSGFVLFFFFRFFFNGPAQFSAVTVALYFLFCLLFITFYPLLMIVAGISAERLKGANLAAVIPLAMVPAAIPLSNELQYALSGTLDIGPPAWARIAIALPLAAGFASYFYFLRHSNQLQTSRVLKYWVFPLTVTAFYLFGAVTGQVKSGLFDLFHLGERTLVTQQLFSYGRIPFMDLIPTHGIMDFFSQGLYSLVNGYHGLDMLMWRWLPVLIGLLLLYFILIRIYDSLFVSLFLIVAPAVMIIHDEYRVCIGVLLVLLWAVRKPVFSRFLLLGFALVLLFFWRYDFGVIGVIATFSVMPVIGFMKSGSGRSFGSLIKWLVRPVAALLVAFVFSLGIYSLLLVMNGHHALDVIGQLYLYFKVQAPTQTVVQIYQENSVLFLLEYMISPMVSVAYITWYLFLPLKARQELHPFRMILLWIAVFSLVMSIRTIQRHTIMEGFNPLFSIFLLCTAPWYFFKVSRPVSGALFLFVLLVYAMLISEMPKRGFVKSEPQDLIPEGEVYSLFDIKRGEPRLIIQDSSQFAALNSFLNENLREDQTFFDFSNAPMLFVLTNRLFPAHIIPNLYQAADPIEDNLTGKLGRYLTDGKLPLVLFRQNTFWDSIDGVPQEIRSYRVAEFIYNNYKPYAKVGNYELWRAGKIQDASDVPVVIRVPLRQKPSFTSNDLVVNKVTADKVEVKTGSKDPFISGFIAADDGIRLDSNKMWTLRITYSTSREGNGQLFYSVDKAPFSEKRVFNLRFHKAETVQEKALQLPYFGHPVVLSDFRLDPPTEAEFSIFSIELTGSPPGMNLTSRPQHFNLMQLPYIWANFDAKEAVTRTKILFDAGFPETLVLSGTSQTIRFNPDFDKTTGNYLHFIVRSDSSGYVTVKYGNRDPSTVRFDLKGSGKPEHYLVRISSQEAWMHEKISAIAVSPSVPVRFEKFFIRKGD